MVKKQIKEVTILYAYGSVNPGDHAIAPGTLEYIKRTNKNCRINLISLFKKDTEEFKKQKEYFSKYYPEVNFICQDFNSTRLIPSSKLDLLVKTLFYFAGFILSSFFNYCFFKSKAFTSILNSDLIIINGGHLIFWNDKMGERNFIIRGIFSIVWMTKKLNKQYVFHGQSYGPFYFKKTEIIQKLLFKKTLTNAKLLTLREPASQPRLFDLLKNKNQISPVLLDSAFFIKDQDNLQANKLFRQHNLHENQFIVFALRLSKRGSQEELEKERIDKYKQVLLDTIKYWSANEDFKLVFVCQVPQDLIDTKNIVQHIPPQAREKFIYIHEDLTPGLLKSIYKSARFIIAMRFHSMIFALSEGTPTIGISYYEIGPKIKGLQELFSLKSYFFEIENSTSDEILKSSISLNNDINFYKSEVLKKLDTLMQTSLLTFKNEIFNK